MIKRLINKLFGNKPVVVTNAVHKHNVAGNSHQRRIARRKAERSIK